VGLSDTLTFTLTDSERRANRFRKSDLVKLELRINGENVDPLSCIAHRTKAFFVGRELTKKLKTLIPRAQFKIPIQAAIGGKVRPACLLCAGRGWGASMVLGV
jgi:GTP-binding protein LepA